MFKRYLYQNYRILSALKFWFERRVTRVGWMVLCSVLVAAGLGMDTSLSLAYQAFTFLFCLCLVAFVGIFLNRFRFTAERTLPRFGSVGEKLSYTILVQNRTGRSQSGLILVEETQDPRPSFEEFASTPEPDEEKRNWYDRTWGYYRWQWLISKNKQAFAEELPLPVLPARGSSEARAELVPLKRGYLRFTRLTLASSDPFGLFRAFRTVALPQSLLILPKRYALPCFELPGTMKYQQGGVALASAVGESEEF